MQFLFFLVVVVVAGITFALRRKLPCFARMTLYTRSLLRSLLLSGVALVRLLVCVYVWEGVG